jgi:hypothetical protein
VTALLDTDDDLQEMVSYRWQAMSSPSYCQAQRFVALNRQVLSEYWH